MRDFYGKRGWMGVNLVKGDWEGDKHPLMWITLN